MRPQAGSAQIRSDVTAFRNGNQILIPRDVDAKFRAKLREAVARDGGPRAKFHINNALHNGPSRGGLNETIAFLGADWNAKLATTAMIVDGLEISMSGFKKWLELTGFGNDKTMVRGFVAWAMHKNALGRVISGLNDSCLSG